MPPAPSRRRSRSPAACASTSRASTPEVAAEYGEVVETPAEADVAILRLQAPFEQRATMFENFFHAGSLDFADETVAHVREVAASVPTVVDVLPRPPRDPHPVRRPCLCDRRRTTARAHAPCSTCWSAMRRPQGTLPFDLPSSMAAVEANRPDVPFDTADPLFRFGHGLRYAD